MGPGGIGGVNHFLLPYGPPPRCPSQRGPGATRFGTEAFARLLHGVLELGARPTRLVAKLFGGACVMEALRAEHLHLGLQNAELAMQLLGAERIPVIAEDVGGRRGRKLVFDTGDGTTTVTTL